MRPIDDNPFHRHSTFFGFLAAAVAVVIAGTFTAWRPSDVALYVGVFLVALWFFARVCYGFSRARAIDKETMPPGTHLKDGERTAFGGWNNLRLVRAYQKMQEGGPSDLERLAQEEDGA
jgi:hypothetical protein